jgi:Tfp pilus assembly PilM family ATPase/Tfp pilus assembly protein PilN
MLNILDFITVRTVNLINVQFNGNSLRIVYFKIKGKRKELTDCAVYDISNSKDDQTTGLLRTFLNKNKITNCRTILTIPSQNVITKNIEVPSQDTQEISDIVNLQAVRHTPYVRQEITVSHSPIGVFRKGYTKILLVIITREVANKQIEIMERAGIHPDKVCLSADAVGFMAADILALQNNDSPSAVIYLDALFSYFSIVLKGKFLFLRAIPIGYQHLLDNSSGFSLKFLEEIKNSLTVYKNEDIERLPHRIILIEDEPRLKSLFSSLIEPLGFPLEIIQYLGAISISSQARAAISAKRSIDWLDCCSSVVKEEDLRIDLTPEEIKLRRSFEEKSKLIVKTGVYSLAVFILIFMILAGRIAFRGSYFSQLNIHSKNLSSEASLLDDKFRKVQLVKKYLAIKGYSLEIIDKIYDSIPERMWLQEIRLDRETKSLMIKGTAELMGVIFEFVDQLEKISYFTEVKTKYTTQRKNDGKDVSDFELAITLVD